jgi:cytochrome P450
VRITRPAPHSRVRLDEIDLARTNLYTSGDAHLVWQTLRTECPVFWQVQPAGHGFWAVTRQADVRRVLSEHETFSSEGGTVIDMLGGPDPAAGLMMQATDPPRHRQLRRHVGKPFTAFSVTAHNGYIRAFVRRAIEPALDGEIWDVAHTFARLPMVVGATMMGLPEADIEPLLRLAYASLAPHDPRYSNGSPETTAIFAHCDIIRYFSARITERRKNLSTDLISHLLSIEIDGRPLTDEELLLNCLSLLLGAVVTTSHAISATCIALAEQHDGEGRWPLAAPLPAVVEEALRWSSPVTHFMRRARRDVELHGRKIRAGEAVTAWIGSANRDESVFEQPYLFNLRRSPNRHVAFGFGAHRCVGSNLARLMLRESFQELISKVECYELAEAPSHLVSNEIAGVVSLPLRVRPRNRIEARKPIEV